ncbi:MAG: hypothetical protein KGJ57_18140 [Sphingomonadales bacterium]|nr:hypothetical protein [Sphingomonadales bacterium]MDE2171319.1 hypothetical protein [Sphingomonadales bacterium]
MTDATTTTGTGTTTFTEQDAADLAALQAKQAQAAWEVSEADRVAKLAAITPIATALGTDEAINTMIAGLRTGRSSVDVDTALRIDRIVQIMGSDALSIMATAQQLAMPAPQPSAQSLSGASGGAGETSA